MTKIYGSNKVRESHIENIDRLIDKLANSEECMRGLGYTDLVEVTRYLRDLRKATENEMFIKD